MASYSTIALVHLQVQKNCYICLTGDAMHEMHNHGKRLDRYLYVHVALGTNNLHGYLIEHVHVPVAWQPPEE